MQKPHESFAIAVGNFLLEQAEDQHYFKAQIEGMETYIKRTGNGFDAMAEPRNTALAMFNMSDTLNSASDWRNYVRFNCSHFLGGYRGIICLFADV